ncbi:MAG: Carboxylesterase type [Verrucomicrobiaceae bacterium]|nr:Carboxylesterase type [Verrucomicrobiaceae bacterium]
MLCLLPMVASCQPPAPAPPAGVTAVRDLNYAGTEEPRQTLDLFVPKTPPAKPLPLVVFIHGGGWTNGSKNDTGAIYALINDGAFIGASLNYRLTDKGTFPIQIHDCKAAIRWLRAHAKDYGIDPQKISVFGISAGGHLASLLGTSGDVKEMEGTVGGNLDQSSRVSCVIDFCGPSDFPIFATQKSAIDPEKPGIITKLFGGPMSQHLDLARAASPVTYITKDDPPFLIIHGTKDPLVPYEQAVELNKLLHDAGVPATLLTGTDAGHVFFSAELVKDMRLFLDKHLVGGGGEIKDGPVAVK